MTTRAVPATGTFRSLRLPNFRRYFVGQGLSMCGTWMQRVGQDWLVLELTHSGTMLGLVAASQFAPILVAAPYGGVVADRMDKRRLLVVTQTVQALLALALGLLTVTGAVRLWMVFILAAVLGATTVFDNPGRQTLLLELVGQGHIRNAVTLNSILNNGSRAVGPAVAGLLIASVGTGVCFLVNAGTFLAMLAALALMEDRQMYRSAVVTRARGQVREGLSYVARTPGLRTPLLMLAAVAALAYEFPVVLPVLASHSFHAGAGVYGAMTATIGAGSVAGGLLIARGPGASPRALIASTLALGCALAIAAAAPTVPVEIIALAAVGVAMVGFFALANTTIQLTAAPRMRGRVMALWAMAFMGTAPIGAPIVGWVTEQVGPRSALALGGVTALLAGALGAPSVIASERSRQLLAPEGRPHHRPDSRRQEAHE